jgi:hypothetical protein
LTVKGRKPQTAQSEARVFLASMAEEWRSWRSPVLKARREFRCWDRMAEEAERDHRGILVSLAAEAQIRSKVSCSAEAEVKTGNRDKQGAVVAPVEMAVAAGTVESFSFLETWSV